MIVDRWKDLVTHRADSSEAVGEYCLQVRNGTHLKWRSITILVIWYHRNQDGPLRIYTLGEFLEDVVWVICGSRSCGSFMVVVGPSVELRCITRGIYTLDAARTLDRLRVCWYE